MAKYRARSTVEAREIGKDGEDVITEAGRVYASPGDYVVQGSDGQVHLLSADDFAEKFERVGAPAKKTAAKPAPKKKTEPSAVERVKARAKKK